ncbi:MAG TPA: hypothetical protein VL068_02115 [Microthrixaceae bacterium]|nr:hypothetical protein [Microthrixaceae bacterium]
MIGVLSQRTVAGGDLFALAGDDADAQLSMVIAALLVLALIIFLATIIYWRMTKPGPKRQKSRVQQSGPRSVPDGTGVQAAPEEQ